METLNMKTSEYFENILTGGFSEKLEWLPLCGRSFSIEPHAIKHIS